MNLMKDCCLFFSKRTLLQKLFSTSGPCKIISRRFISGETLKEGMVIAQGLNKQGIMVTLDHLGESVNNEQSVREAVDGYLGIFERLKSESQNNITVSLKLTQMGLNISDNFCLKNMRQIMQKAKKNNKMVTIDMEDSSYTDRTLYIYRSLLKEGFSGAGIVIQTYLKRSKEDITNLLPLRPRIRLCKGAYNEPHRVAFARKKDVDLNYINLLSTLLSKESLQAGVYPEVATHDEKIINWTINFTREHNIPADKFEFQMLYGIRRDLQEKLIRQNYRVRIYLPYGTHWYPYFMRRLAERPANIWFLLKNICLR